MAAALIAGAGAFRARAEDSAPTVAAPGAEEPAQREGPRPEADAHTSLEPPQLLEELEAEPPVDDAAASPPSPVMLRLSLDINGAVSDAEVVEPVAASWRVAALRAASRLRFAPARRNGQAIAARILFALRFASPAVRAEPSGPQSSAPRTRQPAPGAGAVTEVRVQGERVGALPISTISRPDLERSNANNAADALARLPGFTSEGPHNQRDRNHYVSLRGLPPEYTLVLVDGQRTATEDRGRVNLSNLPREALDRIEVVRGPQAVIFGSDAIGGVVNVITRPHSPRDGLFVDGAYGAFETWRAAASGQLAGRVGAVRATARYEDSQGWTDAWDLDRTLRQKFARSDARPTRKAYVGGGGTLLLSDTHALTLDLRSSFDHRDQQRTVSRYTSEGRRTGEEDRFDQQASLGWSAEWSDRLSLRTTLNLARFRKHKLEQEDALLRSAGRDVGREVHRRAEDVVDWIAGLESRATWAPADDTQVLFLLGARQQARTSDDSDETRSYDAEGFVVGDANFRKPEKIFDKDQGSLFAATQIEQYVGQRLALTAGARLERNSDWAWFLSPAVSAAWQFVPGLAVHYAIGRGYKMPSFESQTRSTTPVFDSLAGLWRAGNPDLVPERSLSQELGLTLRPRPLWSRSKVRWFAGVDVFYIDFAERILQTQELNWQGTGFSLEREVNVGRVSSLGVEASAGLKLTHHAYVSGNITHMRAHNHASDSRLDATPDFTANVLAGGELPMLRTKLSLSLRYVSAQPRIASDGSIRDDSPIERQLALDVNVRQPVAGGLQAFVELRNVLNTRWDRDNDGDTDTPPFHLFFGLTFQLEGTAPPPRSTIRT